MWYLVDENLDFIPEVRLYLDYKAAVGRSPNTIRSYCERLAWFYRFLHQRQMTAMQVQPSDLVEFLIWLCNPYREATNVDVIHQASPMQVSTVNLILQAVGGLYGYLQRHGHLPESPVKYVDVPRSKWLKERDLLAHTRRGRESKTVPQMELKLREPKRRPKTVNDTDFATFVSLIHMGEKPNEDPAGFRDRLICLVLKEGGLRIGELLGIRLEDVDYGQGGVHVRFRSKNSNKARAKAGYGRDRFVHLPQAVLGLLDLYVTEVWLAASPNHDFVWVVLKPDARMRSGVTTYGAPLTRNAVERMFEHYSKRSGVKIHPHMLRHCHATDLVRSFTRNHQPVDWKFIQERLGHTSAVTTMETYTHLNDTDRRDAYDIYLEKRSQTHADS